MADNDLTEQIAETAAGPADARDAAGSFKAQDLDKLIAAQRFLKSQEAAAKNHLGLRLVKLEPPGCG